MYKKGDDTIIIPKAEPNESSLNRTDRQAQVKLQHTKLISHRPLLKNV